MALDPIPDHADRAVSRLAMQYRGKARVEALVRALATRTQGLESALGQLLSERGLDTAAGAQLDVLGSVVGVARGAFDDATYRIWLRARIRLNLSSGGGDDLLELFRLVVEASNTLTLLELPPAGFELHVGGALPFSGELGARFLREARAAGVTGQIVWSEAADADTFTLCDEADDPVSEAARGLGDAADPLVGGRLAGAAG